MTRRELLEVFQSRAFKPVRLYVSDGATCEIRHPDLVIVTPTAAYVGIPETDMPAPASEQVRIIDVQHITRVQQFEPTASQSAG